MYRADLYGRDVPALLRWLGCFGIDGGRCLRFHWGEFSTVKGLGLSVAHTDDGDRHPWHLHFMFLLMQGFIYLPGLPNSKVTAGEQKCWGFDWRWGHEWGNGDGIHLHWGYRVKILHMPWGWDWVRTSWLMSDGKTWANELRTMRHRRQVITDKLPHFFFRDMPMWRGTYPYRYVLRSAQVQEVTATIAVHEMEWRMRAFRWLAWPRKISRSIDVQFSGEVGERAGSWKGGTVGCSYTLRADETPLECLRRMEHERTF